MVALAVGVAAALSFPLLVVVVHGRRQSRRDRRMGARRTDKIRLSDKD
jgi:Na+(H+)/acetate symporter ActP